MKTMMKNFGMLLIAMTITFAASAQEEGRGHRGRHGDHQPPTDEEVRSKMTETAAELGLNEQQTEQFVALQMEGFAARQAAMEERREERQAMRAEMMKKREAHMAKLKEILTEEQFAKWEEMHKERMHHRGKGKKHGRHGEGH